MENYCYIYPIFIYHNYQRFIIIVDPKNIRDVWESNNVHVIYYSILIYMLLCMTNNKLN